MTPREAQDDKSSMLGVTSDNDVISTLCPFAKLVFFPFRDPAFGQPVKCEYGFKTWGLHDPFPSLLVSKSPSRQERNTFTPSPK